MARPMKPLVRSGGYYPSNRWTPLVYPGGYTTANGGEEPAPPPIEKTIIGNPIHITDALAKPVQALSVAIEPYQSGSGDPSPDNVRPISGWTEAKVTRTGKNLFDKAAITPHSWIVVNSATIEFANSFFVSDYIPVEVGKPIICTQRGASRAAYYDRWKNPISYVSWNGGRLNPLYDGYIRITDTNDHLDTLQVEYGTSVTNYEPYQGETYSITFPTSAGTVYGGTIDVTQGKLTVTHGIVDMGTLQWNRDSGGTFYVAWPAKKGGLCDIVCSSLAFWAQPYSFSNYASYPDNIIAANSGSGNKYFYVKCTSYTTAADFKTAMTGQTIAFELEEPIVYDLTPTEITTLLGTNNVWSDSNGDLTLTYLADGNASEIEALNILLGNRYYNNHEADEPTDREALDILLGGTR